MELNNTMRDEIIKLAQAETSVSYARLHSALGTTSDRQLEDILISAIYEGTIQGRIDPKCQIIEVSDWQATLPNDDQCSFIKNVLDDWIKHSETMIKQLSGTAQSSNLRATKYKGADDEHKKKVEKEREALPTTGKGSALDMDGRMMSRESKRRGAFKAGPPQQARNKRPH